MSAETGELSSLSSCPSSAPSYLCSCSVSGTSPSAFSFYHLPRKLTRRLTSNGGVSASRLFPDQHRTQENESFFEHRVCRLSLFAFRGISNEISVFVPVSVSGNVVCDLHPCPLICVFWERLTWIDDEMICAQHHLFPCYENARERARFPDVYRSWQSDRQRDAGNSRDRSIMLFRV